MTKLSTRNAVFQKVQTLKTNRKKRSQYREFVIEGVRNINEAVKNGWEIKNFFCIEGNVSDWAKELLRTVKTECNYLMSGELMQELSQKEETSELLAIASMREENPFKVKYSKSPFFVLFDRPSNKGNLGTVMRSCDAFGVDALFVTGHAVDIYDPEVIAASMGSFFALTVVRFESGEQLDRFMGEVRKNCGSLKVVGSTAHQQTPVYDVDLTGGLMLLIGNETKGLSFAYREWCDILCTIPMAETSTASSFNVGCAASILLYEAAKQRRQK